MFRKYWEGVDARVLRVVATAIAIGIVAFVVEAVGLTLKNRALWVPAMVVFLVCVITAVVCQVIAVRQFVVARRVRRSH